MFSFLQILFFALFLTQSGIAQMVEKPFPAPDFTLKDINGNSVTLHSFRGKTVLLDFWASWCAPCRVTNKQYVLLYEKFKERGFEIVSVSTDVNQKRWRKAVVKDKMTWPQLIDDPDPHKNIAHRWQITSIPRTYLINKKGEFVGVNLSIEVLEGYLKQKLSEN